MVRVWVVVEPFDLPVALLAVEGLGFGQRAVGVEPQNCQTHLSRGGFQFTQHAARNPVAASYPPSKRSSSSQKYDSRQCRAASLVGGSKSTFARAAPSSLSTSPIAP